MVLPPWCKWITTPPSHEDELADFGLDEFDAIQARQLVWLRPEELEDVDCVSDGDDFDTVGRGLGELLPEHGE